MAFYAILSNESGKITSLTIGCDKNLPLHHITQVGRGNVGFAKLSCFAAPIISQQMNQSGYCYHAGRAWQWRRGAKWSHFAVPYLVSGRPPWNGHQPMQFLAIHEGFFTQI